MSKANYFLFTSCLFFLVVKIIAIRFTNFDLFGDEAQYWLWSQNLDFGYYSKPPLLSWIIAVVCSIFGNSIFVIKMIPVFFYCLTSYVIFLLSKKLFDNNEFSFLTAITFFLMPAVTFSSFLVSTDIVLIFFWSLSMLQILIIKERPDKFNFILLGMFVGLAFLAKYAAVYFILCAILISFEKEMKNIYLKQRLSLFYCVLTFGLVIAPNIIWNFNNEWATFGHTVDNAALKRTNLNFVEGLKFFVSQIIMVGPIIFLFFILGIVKNLNINFNIRFLLFFSLPIFFIVLVKSILVRSNANWAAVSLISFSILFVRVVFIISKKIIFVNNIVNLIFGLVFFFLIATNSSYELFKKINGISSFANSLFESNPKYIDRLVIEDRMLFSNLSYIFQNNKIKIYTPYTPNTKIRHHFQITNKLPADFNKNFVFIGHIDRLKYLKNKYTINLVGSKVVLFNKKPIKIYEVIF